MVQGRLQGQPGVAVLTANRLLLVNDAQWKPVVEHVQIDSGLVVQGWQDDKVASLLFQSGAQAVTLENISDRALAQEVAGRVRAKVDEAG